MAARSQGPKFVPRAPTPVLSGAEGNEWHPLPPDYPQLDAEGQRLARVNACCLRATPADFVAAWAFFRATYLDPLPEGVFYKRKVESPPGHYQWVHDMARYGRNIHAAPRGSAKSTIIGLEVPLLLVLTRPYYYLLQILSIHAQVEKRFTIFQQQLCENEYILRDFGNLRPSKSDPRKWALNLLQLSNGASIEGVSVDGRKRGQRPDGIILDDPEYDPKNPAAETELSAHLERLLFRELLPMFDSDTGIFEWIGTLLSCKSGLYAGVTAQDPRFQNFNRRIYAASHQSGAGRRVFFWRQKWSEQALAARRTELGDLAYEAEYNNNPISDQDRVFYLHPKRHFYWINGPELVHYGADDQKITLAHDEWLAGLRRLITVDLRHTEGRGGIRSDFNGILVLGIDSDNVWWVLDLYLARCNVKYLMKKVWELCSQWRPALVGIESAAGQIYFKGWVEEHADELEKLQGWRPVIWSIRYKAKVSKEDRIVALEPRVTRGSLRLPGHLQDRYPFSELIRQMNQFTPDGLSLDHDDALDCLAMVPYCPRITPSGAVDVGGEPLTILEQLAQGRTHDDQTGLSLATAIDFSAIPEEVLLKFLDAREKVAYAGVDDRASVLMRGDRNRGGQRGRIWPPRPLRPSFWRR